MLHSERRSTAVQTHRQRDSEVRDLACKAEEAPLNKALLPSAELQLYTDTDVTPSVELLSVCLECNTGDAK